MIKNYVIVILILFTSFTHAVDCKDIYSKNTFRKKISELKEDYLDSLTASHGKNTETYPTRSEVEEEIFESVKTFSFKTRQTILKDFFKQGKIQGESESLDFDTFDKALNAFLFIDFPDLIRDLYKISNGSVGLKGLSRIYGRKSFNNFVSTRLYLQRHSPPYTLDTFKKIHARYMEGGVDGIKKTHLGKYREDTVYFNLAASDAISKAKLDKILEENPYLYVHNLKERANGVSAEVYYPSLSTLNEKVIGLIKAKNPDLAKELKRFNVVKKEIENSKNSKETLSKLEQEYNEFVESEYKYNQKIVESLTDEAFEWFVRKRDDIGEIDNYKKLKAFAGLVAEYQRKLISIHPFVDGNGRSVREFAVYYAFETEGFVAPRVLYPDGDIFLDLESYKELIWEGLIASVRLKDDMIYRLNFGLKFNHSGHIFLPPPSRVIQLEAKKTTSGKRTVAREYEYMSADYFRAFVSQKIQKDKSILKRLSTDFYKTYTGLKEDALKLFKQDHVVYTNTNSKRKSIVALEPASDDFVTWFTKKGYQDRIVYEEKMRRFYDKDTILWRGLAEEQYVVTENDILDHFRKLTFHMASNNILNRASNTQKSLLRYAMKDFERYNADLFSEGDELVKMAKDHSEAGPLYDSSYGYSTSKNRKVGKAFAMGAMVIADYGQQLKYQHLLSSRVLVGQYKSIKDVDLTTLKQVRSKFSYAYGRQQEVMGIGLADPDAIQVVQTIDEFGSVITTYLRNPENPSQVLVFPGEVNPLDKIDPSKIDRVINL